MKAFDFSIKLVEVCRKKNVDAYEGNIMDIQYPDKSFDYAMSIAVIHHLYGVEHVKKAISEMIRVSRYKIFFFWSWKCKGDC